MAVVVQCMSVCVCTHTHIINNNNKIISLWRKWVARSVTSAYVDVAYASNCVCLSECECVHTHMSVQQFSHKATAYAAAVTHVEGGRLNSKLGQEMKTDIRLQSLSRLDILHWAIRQR